MTWNSIDFYPKKHKNCGFGVFENAIKDGGNVKAYCCLNAENFQENTSKI